jgi:hypothetical protein
MVFTQSPKLQKDRYYPTWLSCVNDPQTIAPIKRYKTNEIQQQKTAET